MGCNSSKPKHTPLQETHAGANHPADNAGRRSVEAQPVVGNKQPYDVQHGEHLEYDEFREPQLEQIDNGLWRDTQNEVAVHNVRQPMDF